MSLQQYVGLFTQLALHVSAYLWRVSEVYSSIFSSLFFNKEGGGGGGAKNIGGGVERKYSHKILLVCSVTLC